MALSGSSNYVTNRDQLITRALRICNEVGTGETVSAARITECALVLNDIFKEWEAAGMQLWKQVTFPVTMTASTGSYTIGVGSTVNVQAPLKVLQIVSRVTATGAEQSLLPLTKNDYDMYNNKITDGTPNQWYYNPPGSISGTEMQGTLYLINRPTAAYVATNVLYVTGILPLQDFDASTDVPDVPSYLYNALVWALADQLCFESGVPLAERTMIGKKADKHFYFAMAFDQEEGSVFFQPNWQQNNE